MWKIEAQRAPKSRNLAPDSIHLEAEDLVRAFWSQAVFAVFEAFVNLDLEQAIADGSNVQPARAGRAFPLMGEENFTLAGLYFEAIELELVGLELVDLHNQ